MPNLVSFVLHGGCTHEFSWPRERLGGYYQVCLRCGVEYIYDWDTMARGKRIAEPSKKEKRAKHTCEG